MSSTVEGSKRKIRLSLLSLKKTNLQKTSVRNSKSDNNEKLRKDNTCKEAASIEDEKLNKISTFEKTATTKDDKHTASVENQEEDIIPCSQVEETLVFSQISLPADDEAQASTVTEQKNETETNDSDFSLEFDQSKESHKGDEDKFNNFQNTSSEIFNSPEDKVSKILNRKDLEKMDCSSTNEENVDVQEKINEIHNSPEVIKICKVLEENEEEEVNEIPNSPEAKVCKILKENERFEEINCGEKKYLHDIPIIKSNIEIADSDEEFEVLAKDKRTFERKMQNTNTSNSQKENSTKKSRKETNLSSTSGKEKNKILKKRKEKSNVSKTSKTKSKSPLLKRKLESVTENSDNEFEKPYKRAKKIQHPQIDSKNKKVEKSKKLKKSQKSISTAAEVNC